MADGTSSSTTLQTATFAAGCFWKPQELFDSIDGVLESTVGYTGGHTLNPTYEDICNTGTGHAEVVQVHFDPARVSYDQLLNAFFEMHDPTQVNRQGPDVGDQYRSEVFTHSDAQAAAAQAKIEGLTAAGQFGRTIATAVSAIGDYWPAEEYHQKFSEKRKRGLVGRLFG